MVNTTDLNGTGKDVLIIFIARYYKIYANLVITGIRYQYKIKQYIILKDSVGLLDLFYYILKPTTTV